MAAIRNVPTDSQLNHMVDTQQKHGVSADETITQNSTASSQPVSVLFVCLGNICRSPMAEAVFRSLTASDRRLGLIDSCGTGAYRTYDHQPLESSCCSSHINWNIIVDEGQPPDPRTMSTLQDNGVLNYGHSARKIRVADFDTFDYILAMDDDNVHDIMRLRTRAMKNKHDGPNKENLSAKVMLFGDFGGNVKGEQVVDPYYGAKNGFAVAYEQMVRFSNGFIAEVLGATK